MKNRLYYHVFLAEEYGLWAPIVMEQLVLMEDVELLNEFDQVSISCVYTDEKSVETFEKLVKLYCPQATITAYKSPLGSKVNDEFLKTIETYNPNTAPITENVTLKKLYDDSKVDDFFALYIHSKGVTSVDKCLKKQEVEEFSRYYRWRQYLNWGVIEKWKDCVAALEVCDVAGVNFMENPYPHFSGNFWWSKSEYLKTLPDPSHEDWYREMQRNSGDWGFRNAPIRYRDEMWLGSKKSFTLFKVHDIKVEDNPVLKYLPRKNYVSR